MSPFRNDPYSLASFGHIDLQPSVMPEKIGRYSSLRNVIGCLPPGYRSVKCDATSHNGTHPGQSIYIETWSLLEAYPPLPPCHEFTPKYKSAKKKYTPLQRPPKKKPRAPLLKFDQWSISNNNPAAGYSIAGLRRSGPICDTFFGICFYFTGICPRIPAAKFIDHNTGCDLFVHRWNDKAVVDR